MERYSTSRVGMFSPSSSFGDDDEASLAAAASTPVNNSSSSPVDANDTNKNHAKGAREVYEESESKYSLPWV